MKAEHKAYFLLTLTMLFWAGNVTIARGVHQDVPPIALSWFRWTLASLFILPFAWNHVRDDWQKINENWPILIFLGILGVGAFNTLQYTALNYTSSLNSLVLQSSSPLCIALAALVFFGDRISLQQAVGMTVSLVGVLIVLCRGELSALVTLKFGIGDLIMLVAVISWAIYTAFLRQKPNIHFLSFAAVTFVIGASAVTPFFIIENAIGRSVNADATTILTIGYVSIFPSLLAYIFYNRGVEIIGPNRTGALIHLTPFIGAILAMIFLDEVPRLFHFLGFALILIGVWWAVREPSQMRAQP